jgi:hypothetical protein
MGRRTNREIWEIAVDRQKERLGDSVNWFPYPALVSLGLTSLFFGHLLFDLNPRIRSQTDVISFDSNMESEGGIWLSVFVRDDDLVVDTDDNHRFLIPLDMKNQKSVAVLAEYLRMKAIETSTDVALKGKIDSVAGSVTIAADQHLKYFHMRPIFAALSEAGISNYAFETKMVLSDVSIEEHKNF